MKVADLEEALLDYWVAQHDPRCAGMTFEWRGDHWVGIGDIQGVPEVCCFGCAPDFRALMKIRSMYPGTESYRPSYEWCDGGPIIERDQIFLNPPSTIHTTGGPNAGWKVYDHWRATVSAAIRTLPPKNEFQKARNIGGLGRGAGETALIAAMRAKVASHFGDEVPDIEKPL